VCVEPNPTARLRAHTEQLPEKHDTTPECQVQHVFFTSTWPIVLSKLANCVSTAAPTPTVPACHYRECEWPVVGFWGVYLQAVVANMTTYLKSLIDSAYQVAWLAMAGLCVRDFSPHVLD